MTDATFRTCYPWLRKSEGGNDDDPDDPGGRTSRGITQREYDGYCTLHDIARGDVWNAPEVIITDIYRTSYWQPWCPQLPAGPDYVFFDEAVNAGLHEAVLVLQRALRVRADGHIGVVTLAAAKTTDPTDLINEMSAGRLQVYDEIVARRPKSRKYLKGWDDRVEFCRKNALTLVAQSVTQSMV
jgi:lysozyme family protein